MGDILAVIGRGGVDTIPIMFSLTSDDGTAIVIAGVLACTPDRAFDAFVDPELLATWWQTEAATDPVVGGAYHMHWPGPGWHLRGMYRAVDRPSLLAFGWSWDHETVTSEVAIRFTAVDQGTTVEITHGYGTDEERDGYVEGWLHFLPRIADAV